MLINHHNGTFTVVDANWVGNPITPELVGIHDFIPPATARIWRLGTTSASPPKQHAASTARARLPIAPSAPKPPRLAGPAQAANTPGTTLNVMATVADGQSHGAVIRFWLDGKPVATQPVRGTATALRLNTATLTAGPHTLTAQAITTDGAISPLSPPLVINVKVLPAPGVTSGNA